nr:MAG TPA: hypothetical protein [Bacteriophage sp.]
MISYSNTFKSRISIYIIRNLLTPKYHWSSIIIYNF